MSDGDDTVSKRYRDLAREEPSAALDASILAASRRAVVAKPSLSRRWGVPVSIAAVLVLGFGLTLEMEHDKPGISTSVPAARPAPAPVPTTIQSPATVAAPAPVLQESAPVQAAKPKAARAVGSVRSDADLESKAAPVAKERAEPEPMQAAPAMELRVAPAQAPAAPAAAAPPAALDYYAAPAGNAASAAPARAKSAARALDSASGQALSPDQELERIAKLRADGQDAEADRALEEFRRRYPGYRIPDATWERVRPR